MSIERTKGLLLEDQEDSVGELPVLDQVVEVVEQLETLGPGTVVANGVEETVSAEDGDQVLDEQQKQGTRGDSEEEVVEDEQGLELEGILVLHDLTAAKDDDEVGDGPHGNLVLCGQWGDTLLEDEGADGVAGDELVALAEEVIELDAKGLIDAEMNLVQDCSCGHVC